MCLVIDGVTPSGNYVYIRRLSNGLISKSCRKHVESVPILASNTGFGRKSARPAGVTKRASLWYSRASSGPAFRESQCSLSSSNNFKKWGLAPADGHLHDGAELLDGLPNARPPTATTLPSGVAPTLRVGISSKARALAATDATGRQRQVGHSGQCRPCTQAAATRVRSESGMRNTCIAKQRPLGLRPHHMPNTATDCVVVQQNKKASEEERRERTHARFDTKVKSKFTTLGGRPQVFVINTSGATSSSKRVTCPSNGEDLSFPFRARRRVHACAKRSGCSKSCAFHRHRIAVMRRRARNALAAATRPAAPGVKALHLAPTAIATS